MKNSLYEYFKYAQNNEEEYVVLLYHKFLPMIKGFGRKLNYDEAESDLTIFLLEFIKHVDLKKFDNRNDGEIVNYMHSAFKSKYINILKSIIKKNIEITELETEFVCNDCYKNLEFMHLFSLMKNLSSMQKKIILGKFYYGYSDVELSHIFSVSRQAIYKQKKRAFELIKLALQEAGDELYGRKIV